MEMDGGGPKDIMIGNLTLKSKEQGIGERSLRMSKTKLNGKEFDLEIAEQREAYWTLLAEQYLLGKQIMKVEYITETEAKENGWSKRPIAFQIADKTGRASWIVAQMDDEGNNGGVLAILTDKNKGDVIPTL
tara:strand:+ start:14565 stop:14960 length:396 start_codon:yes stop_codon:yes gene_type:complete